MKKHIIKSDNYKVVVKNTVSNNAPKSFIQYESEPKTVLINLRKKMCKDIDEIANHIHINDPVSFRTATMYARKDTLLNILAYLDTELSILADNGHIKKEVK